MNRWIVATGLAVALTALAAPVEARHRDQDWRWQQGWQPDWHQGWNKDWDRDWDRDWDDDWRHGRGLVPPAVIAQDLRQKGFRGIKEIKLDDDGEVYKVRAWSPNGRFVRLFFDAHTGRFIRRVFID